MKFFTTLAIGVLLYWGGYTHAQISVTDARGQTITLDEPAERIVALAPHIVENVYSAGAGGKLVAAVAYSD